MTATRVGLVGAGGVARRHARVLSELPDVQVVGVTDVVPAAAEALASAHRTRVYPNVAALLAAGVDVCRTTPVSGAPRAPYCMMGVCFDCLVTVDGVGNRQGCLVRVAEGMRVAVQRGKRELGA
jgi:hypothetical protein